MSPQQSQSQRLQSQLARREKADRHGSSGGVGSGPGAVYEPLMFRSLLSSRRRYTSTQTLKLMSDGRPASSSKVRPTRERGERTLVEGRTLKERASTPRLATSGGLVVPKSHARTHRAASSVVPVEENNSAAAGQGTSARRRRKCSISGMAKPTESSDIPHVTMPGLGRTVSNMSLSSKDAERASTTAPSAANTVDELTIETSTSECGTSQRTEAPRPLERTPAETEPNIITPSERTTPEKETPAEADRPHKPRALTKAKHTLSTKDGPLLKTSHSVQASPLAKSESMIIASTPPPAKTAVKVDQSSATSPPEQMKLFMEVGSLPETAKVAPGTSPAKADVPSKVGAPKQAKPPAILEPSIKLDQLPPARTSPPASLTSSTKIENLGPAKTPAGPDNPPTRLPDRKMPSSKDVSVLNPNKPALVMSAAEAAGFLGVADPSTKEETATHAEATIVAHPVRQADSAQPVLTMGDVGTITGTPQGNFKPPSSDHPSADAAPPANPIPPTQPNPPPDPKPSSKKPEPPKRKHSAYRHPDFLPVFPHPPKVIPISKHPKDAKRVRFGDATVHTIDRYLPQIDRSRSLDMSISDLLHLHSLSAAAAAADAKKPAAGGTDAARQRRRREKHRSNQASIERYSVRLKLEMLVERAEGLKKGEERLLEVLAADGGCVCAREGGDVKRAEGCPDGVVAEAAMDHGPAKLSDRLSPLERWELAVQGKLASVENTDVAKKRGSTSGTEDDGAVQGKRRKAVEEPGGSVGANLRGAPGAIPGHPAASIPDELMAQRQDGDVEKTAMTAVAACPKSLLKADKKVKKGTDSRVAM